jgi:hypothetical protein
MTYAEKADAIQAAVEREFRAGLFAAMSSQRVKRRRMCVLLWRRILAMPCHECAARLGLKSHSFATGDVLRWKYAELEHLERRLELELRLRFAKE